MLVSQQIDDVSGGVSQQPQGMRVGNQLAEQINAISYFGRASMRRPPLRHVAKLTASFAGNVKVFLHEILRSTTARFHCIVAQGDLQVYDAFTGLQQPVYFPNGKGYLTDNGAGFRAVTFGDTTMLVNRGTIARRGTTVAPVPTQSALISVVQGDYSTDYTVTLAGTNTTITTPDNTGDTIRGDIATDVIATSLMTAFAANSLLTLNYSFAQFGSVIQITHIRNTQDTFTVSTTDGLGNQGLLAILGQVQRATDLPLQAPNGYIIEVVGEPSLQVASQFVQYDSSVNPSGNGVWVEVIQPGALTGFDPSTLPHRLQQNGNFLTNGTARALPTFPNRVSNATIYSGAWEFPPLALWPGGMVITFSFYRGSGTGTTDTFSYTVLDGDETSEAIIVALRTLINLNTNYTASGASTHQLSVVTSSHTHGSLETTPTTGLTFPTGAVWVSQANTPLTPNALAGLILKNTTDGSSAVIVTNSTTSILTGGLTRGGRNTFVLGDNLSVTAAGNYFIFGEAPWTDRAAGNTDADSVPYPSFVDTTITNLFVFEGHLGLITPETVVFSRAGDIFNFFRRTVTDVLDDDPIDVNDILHASSGFHSPVIWNGALYLWCDIRQYLVAGITPSSISFSAVTEYPNLPTLQPITAGSRVFFMGLKNGQPRLMDYSLILFVSRPGGESVSDHIPSYIQGTPIKMVADDGLGLVALLTTVGLYVYNYHYTQNQQQRLQNAWGKWTVPPNANILDIGISDGELSVITQNSDGLYLNSMGLDLLGSALLAGDPAFVPGPLAQITVAPNPITLGHSVVYPFVAVGQDSFGNNVPITPVWSKSGGGTIDSATGVFTAGVTDGAYTITATVGSLTGTATVNVASVAVASITITPSSATVVGGDPQAFTAVAKDALGNVLTFTPVWSVASGGGTIDSSTGVFTAGGTAGTFAGTVVCTSGAITASASVHVIAGPVASVTITPSSVSLAAGATQAFTAVAKDASGIPVPSTFTWSVVAGGGSIDSAGLWTSGATLGTYTNTVHCAVGSKSANATVAITVGVLTTVVVTPSPQSVGQLASFTFTATGYDATGGIVAITPVWSAPGGGGTVNSSTGVYTAGGTLGSFTVRATAGGISGDGTVVIGAGTGILTTLSISPSESSGQGGDVVSCGVSGSDAFGNPVDVSATHTTYGRIGDSVSGDDVTMAPAGVGFYPTCFQASAPDGLGNTIWASAGWTQEPSH